MSLRSLQATMAMLVRLPDHNREEALSGFLLGFDLTDQEREIATGLAEDPKVSKYGRSMRGVRWEKIAKAIPLSERYIDTDTLEEIHWDLYEPVAALTPFHELGVGFLDFLLRDPRAHELLKDRAAPFIFDLLKFERAQFEIAVRRRESPPSVPEGSRLAHGRFVTVELDHDIPAFLQRLDSEESNAVPERKRLIVLFLGTEMGWRNFEIDATVRDFLSAELAGEAVACPASYAELAAIGLCKALN